MLSKRLKELRKERNWTQEEVAKKVNITRPAYTQYEMGKREPDYEMIKKLADLFNVSTDYLLCRTDIREQITPTSDDEATVDYLLGRTDIKNPYDEFLNTAKEQYGSRGKKQAEELLENMQALFEGGELPDEDKDEFFRAITEIYFDAKEKNKKYTPKKYRKQDNES